MEAINRFRELFLEVWKEGVFGLNASEIIIGIVIFLIFYVLRRLFARFIISRLNKLVNKTSTKIDNTVVEVIEGPLKFRPSAGQEKKPPQLKTRAIAALVQ